MTEKDVEVPADITVIKVPKYGVKQWNLLYHNFMIIQVKNCV